MIHHWVECSKSKSSLSRIFYDRIITERTLLRVDHHWVETSKSVDHNWVDSFKSGASLNGQYSAHIWNFSVSQWSIGNVKLTKMNKYCPSLYSEENFKTPKLSKFILNYPYYKQTYLKSKIETVKYLSNCWLLTCTNPCVSHSTFLGWRPDLSLTRAPAPGKALHYLLLWQVDSLRLSAGVLVVKLEPVLRVLSQLLVFHEWLRSERNCVIEMKGKTTLSSFSSLLYVIELTTVHLVGLNRVSW